jgi:hypothetical protein
MRVLDLCSGTQSLKSVVEKMGGEYISVDFRKETNPTYCVDILFWDYKSVLKQGDIDFVWFSPDCSPYSSVRTTAKTHRDLYKANALVEAGLDIIQYLKATNWTIENPKTGWLKFQPQMQGLLFVDVDYCQYGFEYKKPERLWLNESLANNFNGKTCPGVKGPCSQIIPGTRKHKRKIGGKGHRGESRVEMLRRVPKDLLTELMRCATTT